MATLQATTINGELAGSNMYVIWYGYHSSTSELNVYPTGMTTANPYAYNLIVQPFDGYFTKAILKNNPYSSYSTGPTGTSGTFSVYVNGTLTHSVQQSYSNPGAGATLTFDFGTNVSFSSGDDLNFKFQSDGYWRYCTLGLLYKTR